MGTNIKVKRKGTKALGGVIRDAEVERFLADNHDEIAAKLEEARLNIASGEVAPLESLPVLLREARRRHKSNG